VIAVVGGGQLARMMAPAAGELGVHLRVLVEGPESSAAQVVVDAPVGAASDENAIRALIAPAEGGPAAVLTFEHEHVPNALLTDLLEHGTPVRPGPDALVHAQDKIVMRRRLTELGVPCPRWAALPVEPAAARAALVEFLAEVGGEAVVKTARGGYDGKGVRVVSVADGGPEQVAEWIDAAAAGGPELLVEEKVPFTRELAVLVARRPSGGAAGTGEVRTWPVVESIQRDGVCAEVIAPAPGLTDDEAERARAAAVRIAEGLGVTGVLGSGRTALAKALFGLLPLDTGRLLVEGREVRLGSPRDAIAAGIGYVPEDRLTEGLFLSQSIAHNIAVGRLDAHRGAAGFLDRAGLDREIADWIGRLHIVAPDAGAPVQSLSGGNQQRVVLARWLATAPKVLILNGPTVGVDVGSKADIHAIVARLSAAGMGVVVISDDLPEVLATCHRILVMKAGRIVDEVAGGSLREADLARRLAA